MKSFSRKRTASKGRKGHSKKRFKQGVPAARLRSNAAERNAVDVTGTAVTYNSTGTFTLLNGTVPGDNLQNRKGRKIAMQSVNVRGLIRFNQAGTAPNFDYLRMMIVYDRQTNGAAPVIGDIIQSLDRTGATASSSLDQLNLSNSDRFKIIAEEVHGIVDESVAAGGGSSGPPQFQSEKPITFKRFIKLGGLETRYNAGTAGTVADINTGSLYLVTVGLPAVADSQWALNFSTRVRFTDV